MISRNARELQIAGCYQLAFPEIRKAARAVQNDMYKTQFPKVSYKACLKFNSIPLVVLVILSVIFLVAGIYRG